jgi:hypothetical protein
VALYSRTGWVVGGTEILLPLRLQAGCMTSSSTLLQPCQERQSQQVQGPGSSSSNTAEGQAKRRQAERGQQSPGREGQRHKGSSQWASQTRAAVSLAMVAQLVKTAMDTATVMVILMVVG